MNTLQTSGLHPHHLAHLQAAGISDEVAAIIGSDPRTVRRMIADGSGPDLDELAERLADRLIARLGRLFAAMAAADMTAAGPATGPAAKLDIPAKDRSHDHHNAA
jgi:hypothetical protein